LQFCVSFEGGAHVFQRAGDVVEGLLLGGCRVLRTVQSASTYPSPFH
jgi:hypothetical protein